MLARSFAVWLPVMLIALALCAVRTGAAGPEAADAAVRKLLEGEGARPGGIVRVFRFPTLVPAGWSVGEAMEEEEEKPVRLEAKEPCWLYFVDRKAGPMYYHATTYLLVTEAKGEVSRADAGWWPEVRNAEGKPVTEVEGKVVAGEETGWWQDAACRVLGDDGPSIQDAQQAVLFPFTTAELPAGCDSLVLLSCPATLPEGASVAVRAGTATEAVAKAAHESFVLLADYGRGKPWPHAAKIIVYDRTTQEYAAHDVTAPPVLLGADGKEIEKDDSGRPLGQWWEDDAHSFLTQVSFGGK